MRACVSCSTDSVKNVSDDRRATAVAVECPLFALAAPVRALIGRSLDVGRFGFPVESNETENWYSRVRSTWRSNGISYTTCMQYCQVALFTYKPINSLV